VSLPLDRWTVSLDAQGRMKRIDAELKEKLSPYGATRSERFRFAYELAFAVLCGEHTNQIVRALLLAWQDVNGMKSSYEFPAPLSHEQAGAGRRKGDTAPFGFHGSTAALRIACQ
jgi:hypothetical protein